MPKGRVGEPRLKGNAIYAWMPKLRYPRNVNPGIQGNTIWAEVAELRLGTGRLGIQDNALGWFAPGLRYLT